MFTFLQATYDEIKKHNLSAPILQCTGLATVGGVVIAAGTAALYARLSESASIAGLAFTVGAAFLYLSSTRAARAYCVWQATILVYEQSDEPPTKLCSEFNHAA